MWGLPGTTWEVQFPNVEVASYYLGQACGEKTFKNAGNFPLFLLWGSAHRTKR